MAYCSKIGSSKHLLDEMHLFWKSRPILLQFLDKIHSPVCADDILNNRAMLDDFGRLSAASFGLISIGDQARSCMVF